MAAAAVARPLQLISSPSVCSAPKNYDAALAPASRRCASLPHTSGRTHCGGRQETRFSSRSLLSLPKNHSGDGLTYASRCCEASTGRKTMKQSRGGEESRFSSLRNLGFRVPVALLSWKATRQTSRKRQGALSCTAALGFEFTPATVVVLSSALSFAALRTYIYFQVEYIIAAMLGRHVPRGGAKVVELNIRGGRNLYYYPADTIQVVAVSTKPNVQLLENQAIRAGVPIQIKSQGPSAISLPSSSMDAVVSVYCFCDIPDKDIVGVLREAVRVLKPGKPLIVVENVGAKNAFLQGMQGIVQTLFNLAGPKRSFTRDLLRYIQEVSELEDLEYEEVFGFADPHLVCVAKKKLPVNKEFSKEVRKGLKKSKA